jgi:hypothetical protein
MVSNNTNNKEIVSLPTSAAYSNELSPSSSNLTKQSKSNLTNNDNNFSKKAPNLYARRSRSELIEIISNRSSMCGSSEILGYSNYYDESVLMNKVASKVVNTVSESIDVSLIMSLTYEITLLFCELIAVFSFLLFLSKSSAKINNGLSRFLS